MEVRAEPFRTLVTADGRQADCVVEYNPLSQGVGRGANGIQTDSATHVITVFSHLDDFDGAEQFSVTSALYPTERFQVLNKGVDRQPFGVILYCRIEDRKMVAPRAPKGGMVPP